MLKGGIMRLRIRCANGVNCKGVGYECLAFLLIILKK